jgi:hypothetical protein
MPTKVAFAVLFVDFNGDSKWNVGSNYALVFSCPSLMEILVVGRRWTTCETAKVNVRFIKFNRDISRSGV